jgi:uncharacterized membrane protein YdjX (TVP38/TMEM64 family)
MWLRIVVVAVVIVGLTLPMVLWQDTLMRALADRDQVVAEIRAAGAWGPAVIVGLIIAQTIIAPIPGQVINFVAGYVYGPWLGMAFSWVGLVIGAAIAMLLARYAGRPLVERLVSPRLLDRLDRLARGRGLGFFLLFFLIPGLPDDLLCFVVGLTRLPLRIMLPMAAVARIPGLVGAVWLGAKAESIPPAGWAAISLLGLVVALLFWRYGERIQNGLLRKLGGNEQRL